jgi:hypothetical protein
MNKKIINLYFRKLVKNCTKNKTLLIKNKNNNNNNNTYKNSYNKNNIKNYNCKHRKTK